MSTPKKTPVKQVKVQYKSTNPYSSPQWPVISAQQASDIQNSLIELLTPIGQWRSTIPRSRGQRHKRSNKKRKVEQSTPETPSEPISQTEIMPEPQMTAHLTIGFNSTTRLLESKNDPNPLTHIFLTDPPSSHHYAHLPLLASIASHPVKLISLPANAESQLCLAIGIPRVSMLGLRLHAPESEVLRTYCEDLADVQASYIDEVKKAKWLGIHISATS